MASYPHTPLAAADEMALWERLQSQDASDARQLLFALHVEFARKMARRHYRDRSRGDLDLADLTQQASSALLEAIDRYDPSRGVPFEAFAARRINGSLADAITHTSEVREQLSARARIQRERVQSLTHGDIDSLSSGDALEAIADLAIGLALGFMIEEGSATDSAGLETSVPFDAYQSAAWREMLSRLSAELDTLPERERMILSHHYLRGVAFETLASLLGVSRGRISQLHHAALLILRRRLALRGYVSLHR